jgi:tetratricopeptide (TPR) repeat protein
LAPFLLNPKQDWPQSRSIERGLWLKENSPKIVVWKLIGYLGFHSGAKVHIIDPLALSDALLARIPAIAEPYWRIGHFERAIPAGYIETLKSGQNLLQDRNLALYYEKLSLIISAPLWSWSRLIEILKMNVGFYDHLIDKDRYKSLKSINDSRRERRLFDIGRRTPREFFSKVTGRLEDERGKLDSEIQVDSEAWQYHQDRGAKYRDLGQYEDAVDSFTKALELHPNCVDCLSKRGFCLIKLERYKPAIVDLTKALDFAPFSARIFSNRGEIYLATERYDLALKDLNSALEHNPNAKRARQNRGLAYFKGFNDREKACEDWKAACELLICQEYNWAKENKVCF